MITNVVLKVHALELWLLFILCAQDDLLLGWMGSAAVGTPQHNSRSGALNVTSSVWKILEDLGFCFFLRGDKKRRVSFMCWRALLSSASAPFAACNPGEHSSYIPPVCPMARSSPRGHTLLLCSRLVLIFREQLFQRINTLPCRRNSGKHPASDSGSRCPSRWTTLCQNRQGFARRPAKGWELQAV